MKVGLVRHFPVIRPYNSDRWMNSHEYREWVLGYDESDIHLGETRLPLAEWAVCYASDLSRAQKTARHIYSGEIRVTPQLREITILPPFESHKRLPFTFWEMMARLAWFGSHHSQVETRPQTAARSRALLESVLAQVNGNVLLVSHGGLMWHLRSELLRRGFRGEKFTTAENGRLYVFEQ